MKGGGDGGWGGGQIDHPQEKLLLKSPALLGLSNELLRVYEEPLHIQNYV